MAQRDQIAEREVDEFETTDSGDGVMTARRQKTRDRLIEAAYEVFSEHGVPGTAVETICERAGFTRGAFYSNFSSKEELFFALMERENDARVARLEESMAAVLPELRGSGADLTEEFIGRLLGNFFGAQAIDRRWCLVQEEFALLAMRSADVATEYRGFSDDFYEKLAVIVSAALGSVGLRFRPSASGSGVVKMLGGIYERTLRESLLSGTMSPTADWSAASDEGLDDMLALVPAMFLALTERIPNPAS